MKTILAVKQQMSQIFDKNGNVIPVTLVKLVSETRFPVGNRVSDNKEASLPLGSEASKFEEGDVVTVSGITKGKGFQGVVKRHGFHGGSRTRGQKHSEREPGSIGSAGKQRVFKGMRMAGRMGGNKITIKNLKVIKIDAEKNQMMISGAVPGRRGTVLKITNS